MSIVLLSFYGMFNSPEERSWAHLVWETNRYFTRRMKRILKNLLFLGTRQSKGRKIKSLVVFLHMGAKLLGFPPAPLWQINLGANKKISHSSFKEMCAYFICCLPKKLIHSLSTHISKNDK